MDTLEINQCNFLDLAFAMQMELYKKLYNTIQHANKQQKKIRVTFEYNPKNFHANFIFTEIQ